MPRLQWHHIFTVTTRYRQNHDEAVIMSIQCLVETLLVSLVLKTLTELPRAQEIVPDRCSPTDDDGNPAWVNLKDPD